MRKEDKIIEDYIREIDFWFYSLKPSDKISLFEGKHRVGVGEK